MPFSRGLGVKKKRKDVSSSVVSLSRPFAAMGLRGPVLKETWGHVAVMDFVGGECGDFVGVAQKGPFSLY
jgi:hypothetical protein